MTAFDNYIAYYGKYTLDLQAQTVTHDMEDATQPNWRGGNNVRWFEFQGNDRLLRNENSGAGLLARMRAQPCRSTCATRALPSSS